MAGFIASALLFEEVLENIFADEVSGIDCVIEIDNGKESEAITFTVRNGVALEV